MKNRHIIPFLLILALALLIWSILIGSANLDYSAIFQKTNQGEMLRTIVFEIRFPRALMAFIAGGSLALCGAILQAYLRNPLADSSILGISPFASLGAIIAIYFGLSAISIWIVPLLSICFAIFGTIILLIFSQRSKSQTGIILSGVILSSFAGGLMALALNLAPNPYAIAEMIDWQIGSFNNISFSELKITIPFILIALITFKGQAKFLDAMILGDESAKSFGFNIERSRNLIIGATGILAGVITAFCGIIGFVGLIVPHILNRLTMALPSKSLFQNFLAGGILTLCADNLSKLLNLQTEIKVGVIMTLIGAPFFLFLLLRKGNKIV